MNLQRMNLAGLKGAQYNPRKDLKPDDPEFQKIQRSIQEFGLVEPIIWNKTTQRIISGHQRLKVLLSIGVEEEDVVIVECDQRQEKILNVLLNRAKGRWDNEKLAALIQELNRAGDIELTGFDAWELQGILDDCGDLNSILQYEIPGEEDEEKGDLAPESFELTFQIPIEEADNIKLYMETTTEAEMELSEAVVAFVKMGV